MMRLASLLQPRLLIMIAALAVVCCCAQYGATQTKGDPFDKANEAKIDPFSVLNKAAAIVGKIDAPKIDVIPQPSIRKNPLSQVISFDVTASPKEVKQGQLVKVSVTATPAKGWHTFGMT